MRFIFNELPTTDNFEPSDISWEKHKLASGLSFYTKGILLGIVCTVFLDFLIRSIGVLDEYTFSVFRNIHLLLMIIPVHEIIHILFLPDRSKAIAGFSWRKLVFFVTTNSVITKRRFLLITLSPFILLTFIPLLSMFFFDNPAIVSAALLNSLVSGLDLNTAYYIAKQPQGKVFRMSGPDLYSADQVEVKNSTQS